MDLPKELQDRLDALPEKEREEALRQLAVASSPDMNDKWKLYAEHFFADAPESVKVQAKHLFFAGAAAVLACCENSVVPDLARKQIHETVTQRVKDEVRMLVARLQEMLGDSVVVQTQEVVPREGQSPEEALAEAAAAVEAQHATKH